MPLFGGKKKNKDQLTENQQNFVPGNSSEPPRPENNQTANGTATKNELIPRNEPQATPRPKLVFHCQLAQGSPTGIISGFTNVKELYQKIAECYDMDANEILYCTLNTHKIDMSRLLGGQIGLEDFIFVHVKGQPKEVEVTKSEDALGLTITDNGAGYAFIKRVKEGSIMDKVPLIAVGDHIEKIDGKNLIGTRHFEVAKMLKEIPKGSTFVIRVVEPLKSGFWEYKQMGGCANTIGVICRRNNIDSDLLAHYMMADQGLCYFQLDSSYKTYVAQSTGKKGSSSVGSGKKTLRMRANGPATVETEDNSSQMAVDKINGLLESFMGINDTDLAQSIWEIGKKQDNPHDFAVAMDNSELGDFGFTDDFVFDLWGAITDAKSGRLESAVKDFNEQF